MKITKNGITKSIQPSEWGQYQRNGWHKSGCPEPQPSQEGLYVIDDYTIGRLDNNHTATGLSH
jgi:hypothetical protein